MIIDLHLEILMLIFIIITVIDLIVSTLRKKIKFEKEILKCMLILYLLLLVKVVILPIWIQVPYMSNVSINQMVQLIPFNR